MACQAQINAARTALGQIRGEMESAENELTELEKKMQEIQKYQKDSDREKERLKLNRTDLNQKLQKIEK